MKRRHFLELGVSGLELAALGGCGFLWGRSVERMPRIGVLTPTSFTTPSFARQNGDAFHQTLTKHGWIDGQNIRIEWCAAESQPRRVPELVDELVSLPVDLIVTLGSTTDSARQVTSTIPIAFIGGSPVITGLVQSVARPGANITGVALGDGTTSSDATPKAPGLATRAAARPQAGGFHRRLQFICGRYGVR